MTTLVLVVTTVFLSIAIGYDKVVASMPTPDTHSDSFVKGDAPSLLLDTAGFTAFMGVISLGETRATGTADVATATSDEAELMTIMGCPAGVSMIPAGLKRASGTIQSGAAAYRVAKSDSGWSMAAARVYANEDAAATAFAQTRDMTGCEASTRTHLVEWTGVLADGSGAPAFSDRVSNGAGAAVDRICWQLQNAIGCYVAPANASATEPAPEFSAEVAAFVTSVSPFSRDRRDE